MVETESTSMEAVAYTSEEAPTSEPKWKPYLGLFNLRSNGNLDHSEFVSSELVWWDWFYGVATVLFFVLLIGIGLTTWWLWRMYSDIPRAEGLPHQHGPFISRMPLDGEANVSQSPREISTAASSSTDSDLKSFLALFSSGFGSSTTSSSE